MTEQEFIIEQQKAVERMKRTAQASTNPKTNIPPIPAFIQTKNGEPSKENENDCRKALPFLDISGLDFNFLNKIKNDKDSSIILALILLLFFENDDKLLLLALLYILL